jgi:deoxyribodipyrimidine photo-lyase
MLSTQELQSKPSEDLIGHFYKMEPAPLPLLSNLGFNRSALAFPDSTINTQLIRNYHLTRDIPSIPGTSKLSLHLRFGTVSIRKLVKTALEYNETWTNELIWREFYMGNILWHYPRVVTESFKKKYERMNWRNDQGEFERWCQGNTGYPIVDAGMRELNRTGYMHNRLRMITASFLTKHLLIDWRWGEAYFAKKLLDYELSSNNGGWQWAASTGCDAVPYFRIFNPYIQQKKFDPEMKYIKQWVDEIDDPVKYPSPMVDHAKARERALQVYSKVQND